MFKAKNSGGGSGRFSYTVVIVAGATHTEPVVRLEFVTSSLLIVNHWMKTSKLNAHAQSHLGSPSDVQYI